MSGRSTLSDASYRRVADETKKAGSTSFRGQQLRDEGKGLDDLVDPAGHGGVRISNGPREIVGKFFRSVRGTAMLEETRFDTTGSMGDNVDKAFNSLPKAFKLYTAGASPVLGRYDVQMITSIFGDIKDNYVLSRSQAEMDEQIAHQMTLLVPEHKGADEPEDPHYGFFAGAYLTKTEISKYGLKHYDFTITDATAHKSFDKDTLIRIFGDKVFERVKENGHQVNKSNLPTPKEVVQDLLKNAHAFMLLVGDDARSFWEDIYGKDRVVTLPRTELVSEVKAAIIGLTEGVITLQSLEEYLKKIANLDSSDVKAIKKAVSVIPIGAQMAFENFDKIPKKGDLFDSKDALWPTTNPEAATIAKTISPSTKKKKTKEWL